MEKNPMLYLIFIQHQAKLFTSEQPILVKNEYCYKNITLIL